MRRRDPEGFAIFVAGMLVDDWEDATPLRRQTWGPEILDDLVWALEFYGMREKISQVSDEGDR